MKLIKFLFLLIFSQVLFAISISMDPPHHYLKIQPGQSMKKTIRITNRDHRPITMKVYVNDWSLKNGEKHFHQPSSTPYSLLNNITVFPSTFKLEAHETKEILMSVQTPKDQKGGRYGVVFFEGVPDDKPKYGGFQVGGRLGCIIYSEAAGTEVSKYNISDGKASLINNVLYIKFKLNNDGNIVLNPKTTIVLLDNESNEIILKKETRQVITLPGDVYSGYFKYKLHRKDLNKENLSLLVTFDFGNNDVVMKEIKVKS